MTDRHLQPFAIDGDAPTRIHSQRVAYQNPWSVLLEDQLVNNDTEQPAGLYGYFAAKSYAIVCAIDDDHNVLLVRQWRHAFNCMSWELPCGALEGDESPIAGGQRELAEETGHQAQHWQALTSFHGSDARVAGMGHAFLATDLQRLPTAPSRDATEADLVWSKAPLSEALSACHDGRITNVASIAVLLLAAARRQG